MNPITSTGAMKEIATLILSSYTDKPQRIASVVKNIFDAKLGKSVSASKLTQVDLYDSVFVAYNAKRNVWVVAIYNRVVRACRGYIFNPLKDECDMKEIENCSFCYNSIALRLEECKLKYRVFTREEAGEFILKAIFGGYYEMGA